ncbi:MAG: hypothetical protein ACQES5_08225 [Thermodesulfobacteriota bacterium]
MSLIEGLAGAGAGGVPHNVRNMNSGRQAGLTDFNNQNENAVRTGKVQKTDFGNPSGSLPHEQTAKADSKEALEARKSILRESPVVFNPGQDSVGSPKTGVLRSANQGLAGAAQALSGKAGNQMQPESMQGGFASGPNAGIGFGFSGMAGGTSQGTHQGTYLNKMI